MLLTIDLRDFDEGFAMSIGPENGQLLTVLTAALEAVTKNGAIGYPEWLQDPGIFSSK